MQDILRLPVAIKKCNLLASDAELGHELDTQLCSMGLQFSLQASARQLGVDFTAGKGRSLETQHARYDKCAIKSTRWQALARAGAPTAAVAQAGIQASTCWGACVLGISDTWLHRLRQQVASCVEGAKAGRSVALRLALSTSPRSDPAYQANSRPLLGWSSAIWAKLMPHALLAKAWSWMVAQHGEEGPPGDRSLDL